MNLLFVCRQNKMRSRTAETIYRNHPEFNVLSAGIKTRSGVSLTPDLIRWANVILTMERKYADHIITQFPAETKGKKVCSLEIGDFYYYMEEELVQLIKTRTTGILNNIQCR